MWPTVGAITFVVALALPLCAVGPTGTIVGTVEDASQAVIPNARVILRNEDTNAAREIRTNADGDYSAPLLDPGLYAIVVEAPNFRRAVHGGIRLEVNRTVRVDVRLELGELRQQLTVTESAPPIQSDTSAVGHLVDRRQVTQLPLNERNFLTFTLLAPGAQMPADGSQNSTQGAAVSVNGAREQSNNFLLDGVDNNDSMINHYTVLPSVDAIQEFQLQSGNSTAEFGRSGGAQVNALLKGGTNSMHGTGFWFTRNRHLDAKNFFDQPDCRPSALPGTCAEIPRLDRNQFGGTAGGPLHRDKAFFFGSYEGLRLRQASTREATVPSRAQRAALLAAVPAAQRNPAGEAILNLYPLANVGSDLGTSTALVAAPVIRNGVNQALAKATYNVSARNMLSGHYGLFDEDRFNPYDPFFSYTNLPGFGSFSRNRGQNAGVTWVHTFDFRRLNEARFGFNRLSAGTLQQSLGKDHSRALGFPPLDTPQRALGYPNVFVAGFDNVGEPTNTPQQRHDNTFHFADNFAWNPQSDGGRHQLKIGTDIRRVQGNIYLDLFSRGVWQFFGVFTGDPLQDLLRGLPTFALTTQGDTTTGLRTTSQNYFVQDDFRIHPRLTLNIGLRYEFNSPPVEQHDRLSVPDLSANSATCSPKPDCQFLIAGTNGVPRGTYAADRNNFAPRVGFAWRPSSRRMFVIRAAYGIFYDVGILNANLVARFNPPFFGAFLFPNSGTNTIQDIVAQPGSGVPPVPARVSPDYRDGYMQQWNFDVQDQVWHDLTLDLAYVGSKGTDLANRTNPNQPRPGGTPPYPQYGPWQFFASSSTSSYNSLQFRAEKRVERGLTFAVGYTWSKSIDDASALYGSLAEPAFPQDSLNRRGERALSNFDTRHRVVASYIYELPLGRGRRWLSHSGPAGHLLGNWEIAGIVAVQSGRPFTVNRSVDQSSTGTFLITPADRPDQIADPSQPGPVANNPDPACHLTVSQGGRAADTVGDPASWFNTCALAAAPGRFGTAGRNSVIGPNLINLDFSALKNIALKGESHRLQFRFEVFNLPNHPNFDLPERLFDSPDFGKVHSANAFGTKPPRQIQLGVKYVF